MVVLANFDGAVVDLPHGNILTRVAFIQECWGDYCGRNRTLIFRAFSLISSIEKNIVVVTVNGVQLKPSMTAGVADGFNG